MDKQIFLSKTEFDFNYKTVLVRIDCDVDLVEENGKLVVDEDFRLKQAIPTIKYLLGKGAGKIILLGHLGRPEGRVVEELRLAPVAEKLKELLSSKFKVQSSKLQLLVQSIKGYEIGESIVLLENLRFNKGEEGNGEGFARELAGLGNVYINDAFGVSHRAHASIVGISKFLPSFLGLNFEREVEVLDEVKENAQKPLVFVLGGSKKDKLDYLVFLGGWCDKVLVGGKLPELICHSEGLCPEESRPPCHAEYIRQAQYKFISASSANGILKQVQDDKIIISNLKSNGRDIDNESIEKFKEIIKTARTLVWAGPMGVYEEEENRKGTFEVAKAIAESSAYKVAGGGDTHRVLSWLNLWDKFDFVSCGGGAMLAFLKEKTLVGIKALMESDVIGV